MKFLADAHVSWSIVTFIRSQGHQVSAAADLGPSMPDTKILDQAWQHGEIVITFDSDFGELAFRHGRPAHGLLYLRLAHLQPPKHLTRITEIWAEIEPQLPANLVVITATRVRVRPLP